MLIATAMRLIRWGLLVLGAAMVLWFAAWFTVFALIMQPFGTSPFRWTFLQANQGWVVLLATGLVSIGAAWGLFVRAHRLPKVEKLRQATDAF